MRADSFDPINTARLDTARSNLMLSPRLGPSLNSNNTPRQQYSPASSLQKPKHDGSNHHTSSSSSGHHNFSNSTHNTDYSSGKGGHQVTGYNSQTSNSSGRSPTGGYSVTKQLSNIDENGDVPNAHDADHEDNGSELEDNDSIYRLVEFVIIYRVCW